MRKTAVFSYSISMFSVILTQNVKFKVTHLPYNKYIWVNLYPNYCTISNIKVSPMWYGLWPNIWPFWVSTCYTKVTFI